LSNFEKLFKFTKFLYIVQIGSWKCIKLFDFTPFIFYLQPNLVISAYGWSHNWKNKNWSKGDVWNVIEHEKLNNSWFGLILRNFNFSFIPSNLISFGVYIFVKGQIIFHFSCEMKNETLVVTK
jgi:hypothetical protein